ncbi:unnamed protein product, partial [Amoebophrya sp. A25]
KDKRKLFSSLQSGSSLDLDEPLDEEVRSSVVRDEQLFQDVEELQHQHQEATSSPAEEQEVEVDEDKNMEEVAATVLAQPHQGQQGDV